MLARTFRIGANGRFFTTMPVVVDEQPSFNLLTPDR